MEEGGCINNFEELEWSNLRAFNSDAPGHTIQIGYTGGVEALNR
jgi:hypothetical protein